MKKDKKKLSANQIYISAGAVLFAAVAVIVGIYGGPNKTVISADKLYEYSTAQDSTDAGFITDEAEIFEAAEPSPEETIQLPENSTTVVSCGAFMLDSVGFAYYLWDAFYDYYSFSGKDLAGELYEYKTIDGSETSQTWLEYLTESALDTAAQTLLLMSAAENEGFTLSAESAADTDAEFAAFSAYITELGYDKPDDYLINMYGEGASADSYKKYLKDTSLASAFTEYIYGTASFTDAEAEAYYDKYADMYLSQGIKKDGTRPVSIRQILIKDEAEALSVWDKWQGMDGSERSFAALAEEYSEDMNSVGMGGDWQEPHNGGLYTNVYPGVILKALDDWAFDTARHGGDSELIKSEEGWHILYFSRIEDRPVWRYIAENDMRMEAYQAWLSTAADKYPVRTDINAVMIVIPAAIKGNK